MSQSGVLTVKTGGGSSTETLTGNTGGAVGPDGSFNINVLGNNTTGINIVGNPGTNTLTVVGIQSTTTQQGTVTLATNAQAIAGSDAQNAVTSAALGAKLGTQTAHSLAVFEGTSSALTALGVASNGQLPIGSTGADPVLSTLTAGTGITITNGAGSITIAASGAELTFDGDTGSATPSGGVINIKAGVSTLNSGSSVSFSGTSSTITLNVTDSSQNTVIGQSAGTATLTMGSSNTGLGYGALKAATTAISNVAVGWNALEAVVSGQNNIGIGVLALQKCTTNNNIGIGYNVGTSIVSGTSNVLIGTTAATLLTGSSNTIIGYAAASLVGGGSNNILIGANVASNLDSTQSSNIIIGNAGNFLDSNVIRIGTQGSGSGQQSTCYIAGIEGVSVSNLNMVTIDTTTGQLGSQVPSNVGTVTQYDVLVGGAAGAIASVGPGSSGQILQSGGNAANPAYSTATYPATTTVNQLLYSSSANTVAGLATANQGVLTTGTGGVPVITAIATNGQLIIGSTAGAPAAATLTPGAGIAITNGSNSITITATGAGFAWSDNSGTFTAVVENGYFITAASTPTLPASPNEGDTVAFVIDNASTCTITGNTGQKIRLGAALSAAAGTCANNARGDTIELVYRSTGTTWFATSAVGTWTVT